MPRFLAPLLLTLLIVFPATAAEDAPAASPPETQQLERLVKTLEDDNTR